MAHRDSVIDRNRVELERHTASLLDRRGDDLADRLQVGVTGTEWVYGWRPPRSAYRSPHGPHSGEARRSAPGPSHVASMVTVFDLRSGMWLR